MICFLDCEFTGLVPNPKLISIALVSESGEELYIELTDGYDEADCSEFVRNIVLPQLDTLVHGRSTAEAKALLADYLSRAGEGSIIEIATDAPQWDWPLFVELAKVDATLPANVQGEPLNLQGYFSALLMIEVADDDVGYAPHHALLDARLIAKYYRALIAGPQTIPLV